MAAIEAVGRGRRRPARRFARAPRAPPPVAARLGDEPDEPFGDARQVRVAGPRRQVAGLGRRLAGEVRGRRPAAPRRSARRGRAPGASRPRPGVASADVEMARGRDQVASPAMDPPSAISIGGSSDRARRAPPRSRGRRSRPGTRRGAPGARRSARGAASVGMSRARWPPRGGRSPRGWRTPPRPGPPPRGTPSAASAGRPACALVARRSARIGSRSSRSAAAVSAASRRPPVGGAGGAGPGSSPRRRRRASGRGRSRSGRATGPDRRPRGRCRAASAPRSRRPSPPRTGRWPARTVARSNERPMTAAADEDLGRRLADRPRAARAGAPGRRAAPTLPGGSPLAERGDDVERQSLRVGGERVDQRVVAASPGRAARTRSRDLVPVQAPSDESSSHPAGARGRFDRRQAVRRSDPRGGTPAEAGAAGRSAGGPGRRRASRVESSARWTSSIQTRPGIGPGDEGRERVGDRLEQPDSRARDCPARRRTPRTPDRRREVDQPADLGRAVSSSAPSRPRPPGVASPARRSSAIGP